MNCDRCPLIRNVSLETDPCLDCPNFQEPTKERRQANDRVKARKRQMGNQTYQFKRRDDK